MFKIINIHYDLVTLIYRKINDYCNFSFPFIIYAYTYRHVRTIML